MVDFGSPVQHLSAASALTCKQRALQQLVRLVPHDLTVLAGARLPLVAIHYQVVRAVVVLWAEVDGKAGREGMASVTYNQVVRMVVVLRANVGRKSSWSALSTQHTTGRGTEQHAAMQPNGTRQHPKHQKIHCITPSQRIPLA